jgi:hypothetical protein
MTEADIRNLVRHEIMQCLPAVNEGYRVAILELGRAVNRQQREHHAEVMKFLRARDDDGDWWKR